MGDYAPERQLLLGEVASEGITEPRLPRGAGRDGSEFLGLAELPDELQILRREPRAELYLQFGDPLLKQVLFCIRSVHHGSVSLPSAPCRLQSLSGGPDLLSRARWHMPLLAQGELMCSNYTPPLAAAGGGFRSDGAAL